jgi:uncharacterized RDD family membrane protein YckC
MTRIEPATIPTGRAITRAESLAHLERYRAPFLLRCGALLIDFILVICVVTLSTVIARLMGGGARSAGGTAEMLGFVSALVLAILNFVFVAAVWGQTIGKWATGIRIERIDGRELSFGRALLRHFVGYPLSLLTLGIGFLMAGLNSEGRTLHDFIAGTVVVREGARRTVSRARRTSS